MKKFISFLLSLVCLLGVFAGCGDNTSDTTGNSSGSDTSVDYTIDENGDYVYELFLDPTFNSGFSVGAANNSVDTYPIDFEMLVPGGTGNYSWLCSQWGCKYGFGDSYGNAAVTGHDPYEVECVDGEYQFECYNEAGALSHALRVNPTAGSITMDLNASVEWADENGNIVPRQSSLEYWPHILISAGFNKTPPIRDLKSLVLTANVSINKCVDLHPAGTYNEGLHAAQFLMYLVVKSTNDAEYMWFGIPFFDNRYPYFAEHDQIDAVENKFLYQVPGSAFAPTGVRADGTVIEINLDLKEYFIRALEIAQNKYGRFMTSTVDNLYVQSMNVGWELPGAFDVSATISNYSLKAISEKPLQ